MIKAERQERVLEALEAQGTVTVKEVSDALGVSEMTVRRDLEELAAQGALVRVHGGARSVGSRQRSVLRREYSHAEKQERNRAQKLEAAAAAVKLVEEGSTIFLGTGTTVEQMATLLPAMSLRVVTNAIGVFNLLEAREEFELCLVGGMYRRRTGAFVGPMAEEAISALGIDAAFLGVNGVYGDAVSTASVEEGRFQQVALEAADARYAVCDASKIGRRDFYAFYQLSGFDALVCDAGVSPEQRAAVEEHTAVIC